MSLVSKLHIDSCLGSGLCKLAENTYLANVYPLGVLVMAVFDETGLVVQFIHLIKLTSSILECFGKDLSPILAYAVNR